MRSIACGARSERPRKGAKMQLLTTRLWSENRAAARLCDELREISAEIEAADAVFNEVTDPDLLEALIYERSALLSRYKYLQKELRKLKNNP